MTIVVKKHNLTDAQQIYRRTRQTEARNVPKEKKRGEGGGGLVWLADRISNRFIMMNKLSEEKTK